VELEGRLEVLVEDFDGVLTRERQFLLLPSGERLELHHPDYAVALATDDHVVVRGVRIDADVAVEAVEIAAAPAPQDAVGPDAIEPEAAPEPAGPTGAQSTIFILVNFRDKVAEPITLTAAQDLLFDTVDGYYRENSFGVMWLTGRVAGYFTLPLDSTVCDSGAIRSYAQAAASRAGIDLSRYSRFVYGFPKNACRWAGLGQVGGAVTHAWINGAFTARVVAHELGHNLGLRHAHALECGATTLADACSTINYGDWADVMGKNIVAHFNAFAKEQLGWLGGSSSVPVTTVTASGTYTVAPYTGTATGPRALKVLRAIDAASGARTWYYVEQRVAAGFDTSLSGNLNLMTGALVRSGSSASTDTSFILDMTPETTSWKDPALPVGRVFDDPDAGVRITTLSAGDAGARVRIDVTAPPCARGTPRLAMTPTATQWGTPGSTRTWTLAVTNTDDVACAARVFTLGATVAAGLSATLSVATLTIAPGSSASATLRVTAAATTGEGFYTVRGTATPDSGAALTASGSFAVSSAFTVTATTDASTYGRNDTVAITARVLSGGAAAPGVPVTFTVTRADSSTVTSTATTDGSGRAAFALRLQGREPSGTWRVLARASSGGITGSGSATFTVR
jgi:hypothetical protein